MKYILKMIFKSKGSQPDLRLCMIFGILCSGSLFSVCGDSERGGKGKELNFS